MDAEDYKRRKRYIRTLTFTRNLAKNPFSASRRVFVAYIKPQRGHRSLIFWNPLTSHVVFRCVEPGKQVYRLRPDMTADFHYGG